MERIRLIIGKFLFGGLLKDLEDLDRVGDCKICGSRLVFLGKFFRYRSSFYGCPKCRLVYYLPEKVEEE